MLTPESADKLVCIIELVGVFDGANKRQSCTLPILHVALQLIHMYLLTAMFMIQYTAFP